jgi:outer membrane protein TolC
MLPAFALAGTAGAGEQPVRRISLAQAIGIAMHSSRTLEAAALQREAAESEAGAARGAMLPRLDAIENYSATDNPVLVFSDLLLQQDFNQGDFSLPTLNHPGTLSNFQSQIQLSFPVYAGGRLLAGFKAAKFGAQAEAWRAARARDEVAFAVIRAYYAALVSEQRVAAVERALDAARSHLTRTRNLFAHGMVVKSDVLRTEVLEGGLEEQQTDANSQLMIARASLAHTLGDEAERLAPRPIPAGGAGAITAAGVTLDGLVRDAVRRRPEIKIAAANVGRAEQAVAIARAGYLPSVNVAAIYENDSERLARAGNNFAVFANARVNLFDGLATKSKVEAGRAELDRAKILATDLEHAIALEVESAYRTLIAARQNLEVARRNSLYAADALQILEDRYGGGLATNVAVLDAQTARERADLELVEARASVLVDHAALELAAGRPIAEGAQPQP